MINNDMFDLGNKRSIIREIFEYSKKRSAEIGVDKVFDFSIGNPSVEPPKQVNETLKKLGDEPDISEFVDEELVWELSYQLKIYADFLGDDEING